MVSAKNKQIPGQIVPLQTGQPVDETRAGGDLKYYNDVNQSNLALKCDYILSELVEARGLYMYYHSPYSFTGVSETMCSR